MSNEAIPTSTEVHIRAAISTLPAYVPGARPKGANIAKLSSNEMPFPPQDAVLEALTQAATTSNRYPEMDGHGLRQALADTYGVDTANVVVGNGSVALIQHLLDTVCDEGDEVVIPWRSFEAYPICIAVAGARVVKVPLTAEGRHDVPALLGAITPHTRVLMVCSPNNPTGPCLTDAELRQILEGVPASVLVLVDEAYLDFVTDPQVGDAMTYLADFPNLVVSRTFSKAHALAGMRVGYMVASRAIISALGAVATPFGVNLPAQAAARAALESHVRECTRERCTQVVAERDRVLAALRENGWVIPDAQGNFFWLGVGEETLALAAHFEAAGILVRPFKGEGVRISIGTPEENDRVLAAARAWVGSRG